MTKRSAGFSAIARRTQRCRCRRCSRSASENFSSAPSGKKERGAADRVGQIAGRERVERRREPVGVGIAAAVEEPRRRGEKRRAEAAQRTAVALEQTEVGELRPAAEKEHVRRLDVAVQQPVPAERDRGVEHRRDDFRDFLAGKPRRDRAFPPPLDQIPERFFLPAEIRRRERGRRFERVRQRHREIRRVALDAVVEDFDDVLAVGQRRVFFDGAAFPLGVFAADELERDEALRAVAPREMHAAEPAFADFPQKRVAADSFPSCAVFVHGSKLYHKRGRVDN